MPGEARAPKERRCRSTSQWAGGHAARTAHTPERHATPEPTCTTWKRREAFGPARPPTARGPDDRPTVHRAVRPACRGSRRFDRSRIGGTLQPGPGANPADPPRSATARGRCSTAEHSQRLPGTSKSRWSLTAADILRPALREILRRRDSLDSKSTASRVITPSNGTVNQAAQDVAGVWSTGASRPIRKAALSSDTVSTGAALPHRFIRHWCPGAERSTVR